MNSIDHVMMADIFMSSWKFSWPQPIFGVPLTSTWSKNRKINDSLHQNICFLLLGLSSTNIVTSGRKYLEGSHMQRTLPMLEEKLFSSWRAAETRTGSWNLDWDGWWWQCFMTLVFMSNFTFDGWIQGICFHFNFDKFFSLDQLVPPYLWFQFGRADYWEQEDEKLSERMPEQLPENILLHFVIWVFRHYFTMLMMMSVIVIMVVMSMAHLDM